MYACQGDEGCHIITNLLVLECLILKEGTCFLLGGMLGRLTCGAQNPAVSVPSSVALGKVLDFASFDPFHLLSSPIF